MEKGSKETAPSWAEPFVVVEALRSKVGVNSRMAAGLKAPVSFSGDIVGVPVLKPRGVKAGALAAWEENVGFFPPAWIFAGVNEGDSTFNAFFDISWLEFVLF